MRNNGLLRSAADTIRRYDMLRPGERVLVALSGGADSVSLLLVLQALGYEVRAFHLNHCLRGAESDRDEAFCRALCAERGVPLHVGRCDIAALSQGKAVEETARRERYRLLERAAEGDKVATRAHPRTTIWRPCCSIWCAAAARRVFPAFRLCAARSSGRSCSQSGARSRRSCAKMGRITSRTAPTSATITRETVCGTACCPCCAALTSRPHRRRSGSASSCGRMRPASAGRRNAVCKLHFVRTAPI